MRKQIAYTVGILGVSLGQLSAQEELPNIDVIQARFNLTGERDFKDTAGSMDYSNINIMSVISKPINITETTFILPLAQYDLTMLSVDGAPTSPIGDEDLHSFSLMAGIVNMEKGSPWIFGGFARAEISSDFQHINGDDFTFDLAAGAGYKFSDQFTLGFGVAAINLNGDAMIFPGINFDWKISEDFRAGLYGPNLIVSYEPCDDWSLSLRGRPSGGYWNITDDMGESRNIDLASYQVGLFGSHRLVDKLFLQAGVGVTLGDELSLQNSDQDDLWSEDMDGALFGEISLVVRAW
ncbi:MAG: hypothetical protein EAZ42_02345 [Verrucomicrobia bacterium]|nr:MAG: hypothetical protein EAZ42_02345 [Verrucomicrobiota bacterium]